MGPRDWFTRDWFRRPAVVFVLVASVFGTLVALTLPALGGFDEGLHFLRAWQVSDGGVFASEQRTPEGTTVFGGDIPDELYDDLYTLFRIGLLEDDAAGVWDHLGDDPPDGRRSFVDFSSAAVYPPVPYLPSALAIRAGRTLGLSTLALVLLARLAGLAAFVAVVAFAIRTLPGRKWVLAALAVLPVLVFQAATVSTDALTVALALLVVASAIRLTVMPPAIVSLRSVITPALATIALAFAKQPYVVIAALLVVPAWRHRGRVGLALTATLVAGAAAAAAWSAWAAARYVPQDFPPAYLDEHGNYAFRNVDPDAQLEYVRSHPWSFLAAIGRTVARAGDTIANDLVAQTTWWHVPGPIVAAAAVAVIALAFVDAHPKLDRMLIAFGAAIATVLVLTVFLLAYSGWNAVGAPRIDALQGRYLFPAAAVALVVVVPSRWGRRSRAGRLGPAVLGGLAAVLAILEIGLLRTFYL